ncbi:kelch repeat-containing protein [Ilyonectria robusta]|uniref:kelch repeat-containing protein n=1 Tax=Ilyonectria robusta TaxID=1079257 RepID=UPI001E8DE6DB|nr:kelch repeat-containing protein [Ilyonectria robusta]KAH8683819.1 kelch repeat-containing protein [Ilyonectria robusta]
MALKNLLCTLLLPLLISPSLALKPPHSQWQTLPNITVAPRQEHATIYLPPDGIVILGGIVPNNSLTPIPFFSTTLVQIYSIKRNTWRTVAPLPKRLNHVNAAAVDGKIYVFGGLDDGGEEQKILRAVPDSWVYDTHADTWSPLPPLPEARGMAGLGVFEGKIFVAGGFTALGLAGGGPHESVDPVSVFDTATLKWLPDFLPQKARALPQKRDHAATAVIDDKMYVIGGFDHGAAHRRDTVFILNFRDLEAGWKTSKATMPTPRGGMASGVVGKKIYTLGGEGNPDAESGVFNQVEVYDTLSNTWTQLEPMKIPKHSSPGTGVGGKVYIPGGGLVAGADPQSLFEAYVPGCDRGW